MKKTTRILCALLAPALAVTFATQLQAQSTVTEKRVVTDSAGGVTISKGSVTEYAPGTQTVYVRTEAAPEPIRYSVTKETTIVDQAGNPVAVETIRPGIPAEVHYVTTGDSTVASRIVVHSAAVPAPAPAVPVATERKTTTTTTRQMTEDEVEAQKERREEAAERAEEAAED